METINYNSVEQIANSDSETKSAEYLNAARNFAKEAVQYLEADSFMCRMAAQEVINSFRDAEGADCEFALYSAANHAEKWLEKAINSNF